MKLKNSTDCYQSNVLFYGCINSVTFMYALYNLSVFLTCYRQPTVKSNEYRY